MWRLWHRKVYPPGGGLAGPTPPYPPSRLQKNPTMENMAAPHNKKKMNADPMIWNLYQKMKTKLQSNGADFPRCVSRVHQASRIPPLEAFYCMHQNF